VDFGWQRVDDAGERHRGSGEPREDDLRDDYAGGRQPAGVEARSNDEVVAADGDQDDVQRRRDDDGGAEERVPATDGFREAPAAVDEGVDVERHDGHVEDEISHRQRRDERVVRAAQLRTVNDGDQNDEVADDTGDNYQRYHDTADCAHDI